MKHGVSADCIHEDRYGYTYLVGVVVIVANHIVHPVWLRRA